MTYKKRIDGRRFDETRKITARAGVVPRADGSAMFQMGNTQAYAAVYGPRDLYPKFLKDPRKGILRCKYNMMPFSGSGERVRPGTSRRSKEISLVIERALSSVVDLYEFPNSVVDVFVELPQTDAGTRCAGLCAASIALADAGIPMKDLVTAVAVGRVDDKVVVDLCYDEEAYPDGPVADIPVGILPRTGEIVLLQMDGEIDKKMLLEAIELAKKTCKDLNKIQRAALKDKFVIEGLKTGVENE